MDVPDFSGFLSNNDSKAHKQLTDAGKILGIRVLDHIIVTRKGYFSFQEAGLMGWYVKLKNLYYDKLKLQKKGLMHDLLTGKVWVKV